MINLVSKVLLGIAMIWAMPGILGLLLVAEKIGHPYALYWVISNILFISVALSIKLRYGVVVLLAWPFFVMIVYSNLEVFRGFFGI
jgi:hypothetical protein